MEGRVSWLKRRGALSAAMAFEHVIKTTPVFDDPHLRS
jgi:hypothetical protein